MDMDMDMDMYKKNLRIRRSHPERTRRRRCWALECHGEREKMGEACGEACACSLIAAVRDCGWSRDEERLQIGAARTRCSSRVSATTKAAVRTRHPCMTVLACCFGGEKMGLVEKEPAWGLRIQIQSIVDQAEAFPAGCWRNMCLGGTQTAACRLFVRTACGGSPRNSARNAWR